MMRTDLRSAIQIIQMDYVEMPGLCLTATQGRRLWTLPSDLCQAALDALAATGFLVKAPSGCYVRRGTPPVHIDESEPLGRSL